MTLDISNVMGEWPAHDYADQREYWMRIRGLLDQMYVEMRDRSFYQVTLEQAAEPTGDEWEVAWLAQTDLGLPINTNSILVWVDSASGEVAGLYGVVDGSTVPQQFDSVYPKNGVVLVESAYTSAAVSSTYNIGDNISDFPSITFTVNQRVKLEIYGRMFVTLASGTGQWGMDFLVDGDKVGTTEYGLPADQGLFSTNATGHLHARAIITLEPGTHTVQMIMGAVGTPGSPPTLDHGGTAYTDEGVRYLQVKGFTVL